MNRMFGVRKLIVSVLCIGVAAIVPVNEYQAAVLIAAISAYNAGNVVEHLAHSGKVRDALSKMAGKFNRSSPDPSGTKK